MKSRNRATAHRADRKAAWPATTVMAPHTLLRCLKPWRRGCGHQVLSCKGVANASIASTSPGSRRQKATPTTHLFRGFLSRLKTPRSIFTSEDFTVPPFHSCSRDASHNHAPARSHLDPAAPQPRAPGHWAPGISACAAAETLAQTRAEAPGVGTGAERAEGAPESSLLARIDKRGAGALRAIRRAGRARATLSPGPRAFRTGEPLPLGPRPPGLLRTLGAAPAYPARPGPTSTSSPSSSAATLQARRSMAARPPGRRRGSAARPLQGGQRAGGRDPSLGTQRHERASGDPR
ncbi:unnamed protein product [Rangifer tarandus platyrhynchus]|uniref:Uncharacterized protein n=1 Tax=Rangifer tarandus platyrhynchus TaxID=3082113 RepID=A0ABN8YCF5_RANTA|nr:unnamed protein product [Rangifer tarandus platyrhynchus]